MFLFSGESCYREFNYAHQPFDKMLEPEVCLSAKRGEVWSSRSWEVMKPDDSEKGDANRGWEMENFCQGFWFPGRFWLE